MRLSYLMFLSLAACSSAGPDPLGPTGTAGGTTSGGGGAGGGTTGSGGVGGGSEICGPDAPRGLEVGMCALDFTLPDADGVPFTLSAQRGKVALVDISAVW